MIADEVYEYPSNVPIDRRLRCQVRTYKSSAKHSPQRRVVHVINLPESQIEDVVKQVVAKHKLKLNATIFYVDYRQGDEIATRVEFSSNNITDIKLYTIPEAEIERVLSA